MSTACQEVVGLLAGKERNRGGDQFVMVPFFSSSWFGALQLGGYWIMRERGDYKIMADTGK